MKLFARLRHLLRRQRFERDLDDELRIHREMTEDRLLREGVPPAEARLAARRTFGNAAQTLENSRSVWTFSWIETLLQDLRYAARGFRRSPGFALTVVATIALGLGLNTALFTIFNAYVLRTVAVRDPNSLYQFAWTGADRSVPFTWRDFEQLRKDGPAFSDAVAMEFLWTRVDDKPIFGELVSGNYFGMIGVGISQGRALTPDDAAAPGAQAVLVLSHTSWKNKFGADPNILGKKILIRGYPFEVVGVTTPGFAGFGGTPIDFWAPITMSVRVTQGANLFDPAQPASLRGVIGRLKPGWDVERARAALLPWAQQLTANRPESERVVGVVLTSRATTVELSLELITFFSPIFAAFGLVLVAACANVANMMLARALSRQREIGIRLSLGAARPRLVRQLLTESVLLALPSAAASLAISQAVLRYGQNLMFATLPSEFVKYITVLPLPPDLRVFGFMLAAAVGASLLFGLAPALQATRPSVVQAARGDFSSEFRPSRLRNALVISQISICALLLIIAGVLLRGGSRIENLDVGLRAQGVINVEVLQSLRAATLRHLAAEPLVESVAGAGRAPLFGPLHSLPFSIDGGKTWNRFAWNFASPEYFDIFAVPMVRGRNFSRDEARDEAPVAIISQATARRLFPETDPLGQSIEVEPNPLMKRFQKQPRHHGARVIGVVRDAVFGWGALGKEVPTIFFPTDPRAPGITLLVRVKGDPENARQRLSTRLTETVPGAVEQMSPMDQVLSVSLYPFRMAYWTSCVVGALALLLTLSGVYGVLSYLVSQRTKEIGIRMALGASPAAVVAMVLRQLVRMAVIGIAIGGVLAIGVSRIFARHLVMMNLYDVLAYTSAAILVFLASMSAAYVPSRRASLVDPVTTLRCD